MKVLEIFKSIQNVMKKFGETGRRKNKNQQKERFLWESQARSLRRVVLIFPAAGKY